MFGVEDGGIVARVRAYVKLMRASRCVTARLDERLARSGLTGTQLGVMEALLHKGPLSQRELGRKVLTSAGNMSDVIDKLQRRGLVARNVDPGDRRQMLVSLTAAGEAMIRAVFPAHAAEIACAMGSLDDAELATLDRLLRKLGRGAQGSLTGGACALAARAAPDHLPGQSFDIERSRERESSA